MSARTLITLGAGGSAERQVPCGQIQIPDLWHIANFIAAQGRSAEERTRAEQMAEAILRVWHVAHDLQNHILRQTDPTPVEVLVQAHNEEEE